MTNGEVMKAVRCFLEALQRSGVRLSAAYLYGSQASGETRPDSDIDLALISEDFTGDWLADQRKVLPALLESDARIEVVRFRPDEFNDESPLAWEIKTKGKKIL